ASGSEFAVITCHLPASELVLWECLESRIVNRSNLRISLEELRDPNRTFLLIHHSCCQSRQSVNEYRPGASGGEHAAKIFPVHQKRRVKLVWSNHSATHI